MVLRRSGYCKPMKYPCLTVKLLFTYRLQNLSKLIKLDLSDNDMSSDSLDSIDEAFSNMPSLEVLDLSFNRSLRFLPEG